MPSGHPKTSTPSSFSAPPSQGITTENSSQKRSKIPGSEQRDAGIVDPALAYFLNGRKLDDVTDIDELDENRKGSYYGNIGRCLHLMGQIDPALICYRKSAILLEKDQALNHTENKAFVRKWIGELLVAKGEFCLAKTFLDASRLKWEIVSPPRVSEIDRLLESIRDKTESCNAICGEDIERFCIAWIFGREAEFEPLRALAVAALPAGVASAGRVSEA